MIAAELSSMKKTNSVRPIWAASNGVIAERRSSMGPLERPGRPPWRRHRAPPFPDMRLVLVPEVLERRDDGRDRGVAERAQGLAGDVGGNARQQIQIPHLPVAPLDAPEDLVQ